MRIRIKTRQKKEKTRAEGQNGWPVAYRWMAVGTLAAYSAVGSKTLNAAQAQDLKRPGQANGSPSQTQGAQPVRRFDIAASSLDAVLTAFEGITGFRVKVSEDGFRSLSSPGVSGVYTPEQALQKLLAGTKLDLPLYLIEFRDFGSRECGDYRGGHHQRGRTGDGFAEICGSAARYRPDHHRRSAEL